MTTTWTMRTSALALVVLLAVACATGAPPRDPLVLTGETIEAVGKKFLETATLYDTLYRAKKVTEADYDRWRAFVPEFQKGYATAFRTWTEAVRTKDAGSAQRAAAIVDSLRVQILELALGVSVTGAKP